MLRQTDPFVAGQDGYHTYRIPALAVSQQETILAFCEDCRFHSADSGQIDLILQRSFDNGRTFQKSQVLVIEEGWTCSNPAEGTNESTILETTDGQLYFNCRNKYRLPDGGNYRAVAWSKDSGESFSPIVHDAALLEPICQASVCRFTDEKHHDRNRVLFSNPASRTRDHMTVRLSYDECRTWPVARVLHEGPAAYSDLCVAPDMSICCLYERGNERPYEKLTFAQFDLEWLTAERWGSCS